MPAASSSFGGGLIQDLREALRKLRERITLCFESLLARPSRLHRMIFKCLRARRPILVIGHFAFVSLYEDVCRVLADGDHFAVVYGKKVRQTTGPYVVGMGDSVQYRTLRGLMNGAVRPSSDPAIIRAIVKQRSGHLINAANGRIDLVGGLARDVAATVVQEYLGVPAPLPQIEGWTHAIFQEIFLNSCDDPEMGAKAQLACAQLKDYLDPLISQRTIEIQRGQQAPDDFLCRILRHSQILPVPLAHDVVYRIVAGTVVAAVDNNRNSVANAMDYLLDHSGPMDQAREAALAGNDQLLLQVVLEALRFYPQNPFLLRRCRTTCTLAPWTGRATLIPANALVLAGTASAMFDASKFADPDEFRTNRAPSDYLHFGRGMHECFGAFIAGAIIPETVKALLLQKRLRRARGRAGRIRYDGAFAEHLFVEFD